MSVYRKIRSVHLSTALLSLAFLSAYAVSAVEFAHRRFLPHSEFSTVETTRLEPGATDARVLARRWRGELESVENSPGFLRFRVVTPLGRTYNVSYAIATGDTRIKTTTNRFLRTLAFMHVSHGIWAVAAALVSLALLTLGVTGLYLWFKNHSSRRTGGVLLFAGAAIALALILSLRNG
jgi:hypothetical protein